MQSWRTSAFWACGLEDDLSWGVLLSHQPREASPILAAPHALPTCLLPTNLCLCLVLNFPARCLVINGVSFGSTPAGDRGTPSPSPVPVPPCPTQFWGWRGGQDGPETRCMCLPLAICLGALMSPSPSWGCLCQVWCPVFQGLVPSLPGLAPSLPGGTRTGALG